MPRNCTIQNRNIYPICARIKKVNIDSSGNQSFFKWLKSLCFRGEIDQKYLENHSFKLY